MNVIYKLFHLILIIFTQIINIKNLVLLISGLINQPASSKSPPTRDKLYPEGKAQSRIRNRNRNTPTTNVQQQQSPQQQQQQQIKENESTVDTGEFHLFIVVFFLDSPSS